MYPFSIKSISIYFYVLAYKFKHRILGGKYTMANVFISYCGPSSVGSNSYM